MRAAEAELGDVIPGGAGAKPEGTPARDTGAPEALPTSDDLEDPQ
jgi:hypothetical protein